MGSSSVYPNGYARPCTITRSSRDRRLDRVSRMKLACRVSSRAPRRVAAAHSTSAGARIAPVLVAGVDTSWSERHDAGRGEVVDFVECRLVEGATAVRVAGQHGGAANSRREAPRGG